jgi:hypothetical protein
LYFIFCKRSQKGSVIWAVKLVKYSQRKLKIHLLVWLLLVYREHHYLKIKLTSIDVITGGRIVIGCAESDDVSTGATHQLVLDYVTDKVIDQLNVGGRLFTSPDLRNLVVVNKGGNTITVFNVATDGKLFQVMTCFCSN